MAFYHRLMREMRQSILRDDFLSYYEKKRLELVRADEEHPSRSPKKAKTSRPTRLGDYEIHTSAQGFSSVRQVSSGEVMHSVNAPSDEADKLYVEQSFLASRLLKRETQAGELVIWDVGLGAASNAMAAIRCFEITYAEKGANVLRPLHLVSFEWDLDPLTLATKNPGCFPHLRHSAPYRILENGKWGHASNLLQWKLLKGDFSGFIESAKVPDLIFYDPFSSKADPALWNAKIFARIFKRCLPKSAELYTYSASTAVRVSLLTAGFFVAEGVGTGPKSDTTIAFTRAAGARTHPLSPHLLGQEWLARWRRSGSKFPTTISNEERPHFEKLIETHRQFLSDSFPKSS
jgi:queuine tRNA-ribosyltransferase